MLDRDAGGQRDYDGRATLRSTTSVNSNQVKSKSANAHTGTTAAQVRQTQTLQYK